MNRKVLFILSAILLALGVCSESRAQSNTYDVFIPISKYIRQGDAEKLSAWFSDNLEISVFSESNETSRAQARQIMKSFFENYTPRTFDIEHTAGRSTMKYALGTLNAGCEVFEVTIFVSIKNDTYRIQQLKIRKVE